MLGLQFASLLIRSSGDKASIQMLSVVLVDPELCSSSSSFFPTVSRLWWGGILGADILDHILVIEVSGPKVEEAGRHTARASGLTPFSMRDTHKES